MTKELTMRDLVEKYCDKPRRIATPGITAPATKTYIFPDLTKGNQDVTIYRCKIQRPVQILEGERSLGSCGE